MLNIRGYDITPSFLASRMDYAVVKQDMTLEEVDHHISECIRLKVNSFNCNPHYLEYISKGLEGSGVPATVCVDIPYGAGTPTAKFKAAEEMIRRGAKGLDTILDFAAVKNKNWRLLEEEAKNFVKAAQGFDTKMIIECHLLTKEEIVAVTKICEEAGISYVKTGSGSVTGPEWTDILLIRETLSPNSKTRIKFSGTGRYWTSLVALTGFALGADLIGSRSTSQIIADLPKLEALFRRVQITA